MNISRILIVDDDSGIRRITHLVLSKKTDWEIVEADSGIEALKKLESFSPDVIVIDVMMPKMDGITTYGKILEMGFKSTPVIFMTAKVQSREVSTYYDLGAAGVITKPFSPKDLPDQIKSIVSSWKSEEMKVCSQP